MRDRIGELRNKAQVKLNIGCGERTTPGAINVDLCGSADIVADARQLPFPDSCADWLESHHMLEHFDLEDGSKVIAEWARVIKPGGTLWVTMPDILAIHGYMDMSRQYPEMWQALIRFFYGENREGMRHLSAYCPDYLKTKLVDFKCEFCDWPYRPTPSFGVLACRI